MGFDFREADDIAAIQNKLSESFEYTAPQVAGRGALLSYLRSEVDERVGVDIIRQVYNERKLVMPMILVLDDPIVSQFLTQRGLIE